MNNDTRTARRRVGFVAASTAAAGLLLLGACDFDVTNPGPVQDQFLDDPAAAEAIVTGMNRTFNDAFNEIARRGGSSPRELFPAGNTGRIGISAFQRRGDYRFDDSDGEWELAQNARWVADRGIERLETILENPESSELMAEAALWGGYSHRFNGENFCQAVIDGSAAQDHTVYFETAEDRFTRAMNVAAAAGNDEFALAAQAGRASVRVHLGDWSGAAADAEAVIDADPDFVFSTPFFADDEDQYNHMFYAQEAVPYRSFTVWSTPQEEYYENTGDPRVRWETDPEFPEGSQPIGDLGAVPFYRNLKYTSRSDPVRLSTAREMHLILAEAEIRGIGGDFNDAIDRINEELRAGLESDDGGPVPEVSASNEEEAWEALIRERGIELWLEGRRLGDFRRWLGVEDFPTDRFHPLEIPPEQDGEAVFLDADRDLCFPISQDEMETNENIDLPSG